MGKQGEEITLLTPLAKKSKKNLFYGFVKIDDLVKSRERVIASASEAISFL